MTTMAAVENNVENWEVDLKRKYTEEEQDAIFDAYIAALEAGDAEKANKVAALMPIHPRWAKIVAEVVGKEYLVSNFNITQADEVYGEGWLNGIQEKVW